MRSAGPRQLTFAFADSPQGGEGGCTPNEFGETPSLLRTAEDTPTGRPAAGKAEPVSLMEQITHPRNMAKALRNVVRNKGAPGVDGCSVEEVRASARDIYPRLCRELLTGSFRPGDIRRVWIPKPGGGQRGLGIPNVVDRWVQQAVLQVLEPIYEPTFHRSSHGFRPRRGAHTAIAEAKEYVAAGKRIVVDIDLSKFFDRVNHQRLMARLEQRVDDRRVLTLVLRMLKAKVVLPDGMRVTTEEGTPQGGPLSPLLSNIVLDELDWELDRRGLSFVRYADDCNILVRSKRAGDRVMASIRRYIERRLRLVVNEEKSAVARPEQRHFLGFRLGVSLDGRVDVHLSERTRERLDDKIRELTPRTWGQSLDTLLEQMNRYLRGWVGYFKTVTETGARLFKRYDAHIRRRIRAIIIRQKKRSRHLYCHLVACGVSTRAAALTAFQRRGIWHRSNSRGINTAYGLAWFRERLVSLWSRWCRFHPSPRPASGQGFLFDLQRYLPKEPDV